MKFCKECNESKSLLEFNACKSSQDGLQRICKLCEKNYRIQNKEKRYSNSQKYQKVNKDKILIQQNKRRSTSEYQEYIRNYYLKNKEQMNLNSKAYSTQNKVLRREKNKLYRRDKRKNDHIERIKDTLRANLYNNLFHKQVSHVKNLGCTVQELKVHIEAKFYSHPISNKLMTWENHGKGLGKWQIDHILEFQELDLTLKENQEKVVHYTNLQPLWYEDHIMKTNNTRKKLNGVELWHHL